LILLIDTVLLQSFRLFLYVIDTLIERLLRAHLGELLVVSVGMLVVALIDYARCTRTIATSMHYSTLVLIAELKVVPIHLVSPAASGRRHGTQLLNMSRVLIVMKVVLVVGACRGGLRVAVRGLPLLVDVVRGSADVGSLL
jgi:hypothetical protein